MRSRGLTVAVPTLIFITIINFTLMHLAPGDPTDFMLPPDVAYTALDIKYDANHQIVESEESETYEEFLKKQLGLDKPVYVQYFIWLRNLAQGNFGRSMITKKDVREEMVRPAPSLGRAPQGTRRIRVALG